MLRRLNSLVRGWAYFYRHCYGAKNVFSRLDWYIGDRIWRWLRKKYPRAGARVLLTRFKGRTIGGRRKVWRADGVEQFIAAKLRVERFRLAWMSLPDFAMTSGEPDA